MVRQRPLRRRRRGRQLPGTRRTGRAAAAGWGSNNRLRVGRQLPVAVAYHRLDVDDVAADVQIHGRRPAAGALRLRRRRRW